MVIAMCIAFVSLSKSQPKIAYIYIDSLFYEFDYTKEAHRQLKTMFIKEQNEIDSLNFELHRISKGDIKPINNNIVETLFLNIEMKQTKLNNDKIEFAEKMETNIWAQINQYIKEFGEENNYDIIIGSNENSSIKYGNSKYDITHKVIEYINQKYSGI